MTALDRLAELDAPARLRARDASLFSADPDVQDEVLDNLGWTELVADAAQVRSVVEGVVIDAAEEGFTDVVLLGMGGSSLASLVIGSVLGRPDGPRLHVLDTTSPITVRQLLEDFEPERTLFVVASKSGTTIEPLSLYAIFRQAADGALGHGGAGARFIAITDPWTALEQLARDDDFRVIVPAPATVGGRYSALTTFGLVPAALLGVDLDRLLERAAPMEAACAAAAPSNPAALLAAFAVDAHDAGRDKLTIVSSPELASFGLWVEQLVAESLGKNGTGIVPVVELGDDKPLGFGPDRALVVVRYEDDDRLAEWAAEWSARMPVHEIVWRDGYDLGAEFVRWEHAVALMGPLMGVNPFGQPNVAAAKAATAGVLDGSVEPPPIDLHTEAENVGITYAGALEGPGHEDCDLSTAVGHAIAALRKDDFFALLAYLPDDAELLAPLMSVIPKVSAETGVAVTFELGPRYLHSTGQLHKGGSDNGLYLLVTTNDDRDVEVPGRPWCLGALHRAQATGDLVTLTEAGRRVLWIDLPDARALSIEMLARDLARAAGVVIEW